MALTLELQEAVGQGNWPAVQTLLAERGRALSEITNPDRESLQKIAEADAKLQERFQASRLGLLQRMTKLKNAGAANKLYRRAV
jgi:hypothetical protein